MDHQQIFPTNLFIQDDFLARQRIPAMKDKILSLYERKKPNWQTGPDLDKTDPFDWFAKDVSKEVFKSIDAMDYIADTIEITSMWGNVLKPGETHQPHSHSNNFLSGVFYIDADDTSGITNPLELNGVSEGDIILKINDLPATWANLTTALKLTFPGDEILLELYGKDANKEVLVKTIASN